MDTILNQLTGKEAAAAELGIDLDKIHRIKLEMETLRRTGILLDITISGATLFERKAAFMELGVPEGDKKIERYSPGSKYLLPKDVYGRLKSIVTQIRSLSEEYGEDVTGFYPYKWYSYKSYWAFRTKWDKLVQKFSEIRSEILTNYDYYRDTIATDYHETATTAWEAIQSQGYGAVILESRGQKRAYLDKASFVQAIVTSALEAYPSYSQVDRELHADYKVGVVYSDFDFTQEEAKATALRSELKTKLDIDDAEKREALEKYSHTIRMQRLEREEKEAAIEAMIKAEMGRIRATLSEELTPLEQVVAAWRNRIAQDCIEIRDSLNKNGFLKGKVAQKAAGLVEFYDLVATHNDRELREKLVALKNQIGAIGDARTAETPTRNTQAIATTLDEIFTIAHKSVKEMDAGIRASFLE